MEDNQEKKTFGIFVFLIIIFVIGIIYNKYFPSPKECIITDTIPCNITVCIDSSVFTFNDTTKILIKQTKYFYGGIKNK